MTYDPRKAAQTIAYLTIKNGRNPLNVVKAVKLVYLADRESVRRSGFPIQDEPRVSMKHGPVNSFTYDLIKGEGDHDQALCGWSDHLKDCANHRIGLADRNLEIEDLDELSDAEVAVLNTVWDKFGAMDQWQLVDWTHQPENVPEWEDPGITSTIIPLERIIRALGINDTAQQSAMVNGLGFAKGIVKSL